MSNFTFLCPSCQQNIQASSEHSGMEVDCPLCHTKLIIPASPEAAPAAPTPPAKGKLQMAASTTEHKPQNVAPPPPPRKKKKKIPVGTIVGSLVGVAVVVAGIIVGPGLYHKYKAESDAKKAAEEAAENPPPPPPEPGAAEIFAKVSDKYKTFSSFAAQGRTTANLDMSALIPNNPAAKALTLTADTAIRLARPDLFRLQWELQAAGSAQSVKGAAWCAGKGNYVAVGTPYPSKTRDREAALAQASGATATLGPLLAELFFHDQDVMGQAPGDLSKTNSQNLNGQDCYVLTGAEGPLQLELWVDKKDFLVAQAEVFLTGQLDNAAYKAETNSATKAEMLRFSKIRGDITETYQNILTDKPTVPADFEKPITNLVTR